MRGVFSLNSGTVLFVELFIALLSPRVDKFFYVQVQRFANFVVCRLGSECYANIFRSPCGVPKVWYLLSVRTSKGFRLDCNDIQFHRLISLVCFIFFRPLLLGVLLDLTRLAGIIARVLPNFYFNCFQNIITNIMAVYIAIDKSNSLDIFFESFLPWNFPYLCKIFLTWFHISP